jgi:hypothetical protein
MNKPLVAFWAVGLSIIGVGIYGFIEGVKVYPQAVERADQRRDFENRTGKSARQGTLLVHEAAGPPVPEADARVVHGRQACARAIKSACGA